MHKIFTNQWLILAGALVLAGLAILGAGAVTPPPHLIPYT